MQQGMWTIRPCPHRESSTLAQELGVSEITASVLVRRGYGDSAQARAFLAGEQPLHDPFLLGDMEAACAAIRAAVARGARVDPASVDERAVGFRLAPRLNAAGRLGHPRAALELLLTDDEDAANRLAYEL